MIKAPAADPPRRSPVSLPVSLIDDRPSLAELERRYIQLVLAETDGNKSRAAEILGIDRRTIYRYLEPANSQSADGSE